MRVNVVIQTCLHFLKCAFPLAKVVCTTITTSLGFLGQHNRNRNDIICAKPLKVSRARDTLGCMTQIRSFPFLLCCPRKPRLDSKRSHYCSYANYINRNDLICVMPPKVVQGKGQLRLHDTDKIISIFFM